MIQGFPCEIRNDIGDAQNWICAECTKPIDSFHHMLQNTKPNRKNFSLFLNSPMNCVGLCQYCHDNFPHKYRITEAQAEVYEQYLQKLKEIKND